MTFTVRACPLRTKSLLPVSRNAAITVNYDAATATRPARMRVHHDGRGTAVAVDTAADDPYRAAAAQVFYLDPSALERIPNADQQAPATRRTYRFPFATRRPRVENS